MKKLFAVVLILALALCGCAQKPEDKNSSGISDLENAGNSGASDVSFNKERAKWNTKNTANVVWCSSFCYDDETDTLFYNSTEIKNGKYSYSIVAKKGDEEKVLSKESAGCLYVFENKIYFSNDSQILCMNTDGTGRKVILESSGKNILPYWDGVLYINYDDWKIHRIAPDGSESILNTQMKVSQFMIYDGIIFYGGFRNELGTMFELRYFDPVTETDGLLFEDVCEFDIANDRFYIKNENNVLSVYGFDLEFVETIAYDVKYHFYAYDDYLMYLTGNIGEDARLVRYDYKTNENKTLYTSECREFLCGPYICEENYEGTHIERWQQPEEKITKYQGKENYTDVSLGYGYFAQNDEYYYYIDFDEFFGINKKTKERVSVAKMVSQVIYVTGDTVCLYDSEDNILFFDITTKKLTKKSHKDCFGEALYQPELFLTKDGFVASENGDIYFVDSELKTKKLLKPDGCNFVLDDEIFYVDEFGGNIYNYNIKTDKTTYVTDYKPTYRSRDVYEEGLRSQILKYLGRGKILAYGDDKLQIINLADGSSYRPYTQEQEKEMDRIDAIYDDDAMYFLVWETRNDYRIDAVSYETFKPTTIYKGKWTENAEEMSITDDYNITILEADDQYIYFRDFASMEKGNHFRIKKDGSGKEVLFSHMGEEHYSIEKYE
ncbi:MAG: hypothetical protein IJ370_01255 [Oscillospiraceae bacterium]|nr:hypothetical protein [Oscillospiraceae bacterium]